MKVATSSDSSAACRRIAPAALAACSTIAAFCRVDSSISAIAWLAWATPLACSPLAVEMVSSRPATSCTWASTARMVSPAAPAMPVPAAISALESLMSFLISFAADAECWARLRTSAATTAKPRPSAPARAASTAAFSARILVWKAMLSIMPVMSVILSAEALIAPMRATTSSTAWALRVATFEADWASAFAERALALLRSMASRSSSIAPTVWRRLAAWRSVRRDRSWLPSAISPEAASIARAPASTWDTVAATPPVMPLRASNRRPISSARAWRMTGRRSPFATCSARLTACCSGPTMFRVSIQASSAPIPRAPRPSASTSDFPNSEAEADSLARRCAASVSWASKASSAPV